MFKISQKIRRLSVEEKNQYKEDGYLTGLPVFSSDAIDDLNNFFVSLSKKIDKNIDINQTAQWHKASSKFYKLCTTPEILDYVEDLLGPNFFFMGRSIFSKRTKRWISCPMASRCSILAHISSECSYCLACSL